MASTCGKRKSTLAKRTGIKLVARMQVGAAPPQAVATPKSPLSKSTLAKRTIILKRNINKPVVVAAAEPPVVTTIPTPDIPVMSVYTVLDVRTAACRALDAARDDFPPAYREDSWSSVIPHHLKVWRWTMNSLRGLIPWTVPYAVRGFVSFETDVQRVRFVLESAQVHLPHAPMDDIIAMLPASDLAPDAKSQIYAALDCLKRGFLSDGGDVRDLRLDDASMSRVDEAVEVKL